MLLQACQRGDVALAGDKACVTPHMGVSLLLLFQP